MRALIFIAASLAVTSCTGEIGRNNPKGDPFEMSGAGGRDLSEYWPDLDVPLSQNTRMLDFDMLKSEVQRATGHSWVVSGVDQWDRNRGPLGGADYVSSFSDDLTPSQQRIVLIRKMAISVCTDLVAAEAGQATRTVFSDVDPGAAVDATSATTTAQIKTLFKTIYLDDPTDADIADTQALIGKLGTDGHIAWRGVCASYLASMKFLTY